MSMVINKYLVKHVFCQLALPGNLIFPVKTLDCTKNWYVTRARDGSVSSALDSWPASSSSNPLSSKICKWKKKKILQNKDLIDLKQFKLIYKTQKIYFFFTH